MQRNLIRSDFYLFDGVNAFREANRIPVDALYYAENSRFEGGRWASRKGYTVFGDEQAGGTNIKGLIPYERFPGGIETPYVMSYYNSTFYRYDLADDSNVAITPTWTATDTEVEGVSYNGAFYVGDGVNLIGKIDDTTFSTVADSPKARLLSTWAEKMWAVDNEAPATIQYTATASASTPLNIEDWTTVDSAGANLIGKGGRIEALQQLNEKLYILKNDQIDVATSFYTDDVVPVLAFQPITKNTGAINSRATTIVENDIWFLDPNLEIRSLGNEANYFEEQRTKDMSILIKRYRRDLDPDQSGAVSWYNNGIFKLATKGNGSSQNNLIFTYERDTGGWSFDKATSPQVACTVDGQSFFGVDGNSGQIYKDETGYSDNGFAMGWGGRTGLRDHARPDMYKSGRYVYVRGERSEGVVITVNLVGEDYTVLDTATIPEPTEAEIAAGGTDVAGDWGPAGDIVGGEGYDGEDPGAPPVYRFNWTWSVGATERMFGLEFRSSLLAQRAFIDEAKLKYIPRGDKYTPVDA